MLLPMSTFCVDISEDGEDLLQNLKLLARKWSLASGLFLKSSLGSKSHLQCDSRAFVNLIEKTYVMHYKRAPLAKHQLWLTFLHKYKMVELDLTQHLIWMEILQKRKHCWEVSRAPRNCESDIFEWKNESFAISAILRANPQEDLKKRWSGFSPPCGVQIPV